jgi:hypothetical protein
MKIRHSSLPKLALCGQYEGTQGNSSAASRGTMLDGVFRDAWMTGQLPDNLSADDEAAVRWALSQCTLLNAGGEGMTTVEKFCKIQTSGIEHMGTADGIAVKGKWLIDLKSGQIYDYTGQMAAYALGLMEIHFEQEWTTHLLFCDQQKVVTQYWTYTSARETVQAILDNVGTAPKENDYCGWCAKSLTCLARIKSSDHALSVMDGIQPKTPQDHGFLQLLEDPARIGKFLAACSTLEDFREAAADKARQLLEAGEQVPGWRLQKPRATEFVGAEYVAKAVQEGLIGAGDAINAYGSLSAKKAEQLWSVAGHELPAYVVSRKVGKPPLVASK